MKWTLEQYLQAIRERLDETEDKEYYKDTELTRYLNTAILDLTDALQLKDIKIIPPMNKDRFKISDVFTKDDRFCSIEFLMIDGQIVPIKDIQTAKYEYTAYQYGDWVVFPYVVNSPIECYYLKYPKPLVDLQDTTDIPERFQHVPIDLVIAFCKEKDEEWEQAQQARIHYEQKKIEMKHELEKAETQQQFEAVVVDNYRE